jgi:hypothetical protein
VLEKPFVGFQESADFAARWLCDAALLHSQIPDL